MSRFGFGLLLGCFTACAGSSHADPPASPSAQSDQRRTDDGTEPIAVAPEPIAVAPEPNPPAEVPFAALVREVAASFSTWGLVDAQFHWAPGSCAVPVAGVQHLSTAGAAAGHGEKVFRLHALDAMAYWKATDTTTRLPKSFGSVAQLTSRRDVLQVLVKESFAPRPLGAQSRDGMMRAARNGDSFFGAGDPIGLFVMAQLRDAPEGTDEGWIYATVAPTGEVTAAGVIAACRDCHAQQADRVFGMPLHWPLLWK